MKQNKKVKFLRNERVQSRWSLAPLRTRNCGRYVGKVTKVNTRRTKSMSKSDNVTADFDDGPGDFCAHADTYGVDNTWVVLTHSRGGGAGAGGAGGRPRRPCMEQAS